MKDKEIELKWVPFNTEMLKETVKIKQTIGNYSIVQLPDNKEAILDRESSQILVSSKDWYNIPSDWEKWLNGGFIVVSFPEPPLDTTYCFFSIQEKEFIARLKGSEIYTLLESASNYYILEENGKYGIFDFNEDGRLVSDWFDGIYAHGLLRGLSDYYLATKNGKEAVFHKSGKQVSDWFDDISIFGLPEGKSDYYIATKNGKEAIFHKDGKQISNWFDSILFDGLVSGQSDYYLAEKNGKKAIFDKDGKQVSDWLDGSFMITGLFHGISDYYVVRGKDELYYIYKLGSKKVMGPIAYIEDYGFISNPSKNMVILEMPKRITLESPNRRYEIFTRQELEQFFEEKAVEDER